MSEQGQACLARQLCSGAHGSVFKPPSLSPVFSLHHHDAHVQLGSNAGQVADAGSVVEYLREMPDEEKARRLTWMKKLRGIMSYTVRCGSLGQSVSTWTDSQGFSLHISQIGFMMISLK